MLTESKNITIKMKKGDIFIKYTPIYYTKYVTHLPCFIIYIPSIM